VAKPSEGGVPDVSVVVVLSDQSNVSRQTLSALADQSGVSYEVIVIDNASGDDAEALLERLDGARIVRNCKNLGFLRAANQGATLAQGRYIVLLGGATILQVDALTHAVARLDDEGDIGAVLGKDVHSDARLQDAESITGRNELNSEVCADLDSFSAEIRFSRDVDFGSRAYLMVRRTLWERLKGFDTIYAPTWSRDRDFCMRLSGAGYRVVFDTRSCIWRPEQGRVVPNNTTPARKTHDQFILRGLGGESLALYGVPVLARPVNDHGFAWQRPFASVAGKVVPQVTIECNAPRSGVIPLRTTVQSFDLFDTLIARACVTPANLFAEVGTAFGLKDFPSARMAAEQRTLASGDAFDLEAIYRELCAGGYCDASTARQLMASEIEAEFDNAIPIVENIAAVRDFDLVVSDMYLPPAILHGLMQRVGLRRFVHLFVSNDGKHLGTIWPQLAQKWLILRHIGDNERSDVELPRQFGIATTRYAGANISRAEQYLEDAGLPLLARIVRQLRLANPYVSGTVEAGLWNHFVEYNIPLLCLSAAEARKQRDIAGKDKILFIGRDCYFLSEVFLALYPGESSQLIHVSRAALAADPAGFSGYLDRCDLSNALLCDLVSTGLSWLRFSQVTGRATSLFAIVHIDNYQYQAFDPAELDRQENYRFLHAVCSSELANFSLAIEILNTAPHGSTVAVERIGDEFAPRFDAHQELPATMLKGLLLAQAAAVPCLRSGRTALEQELAHVPDSRELFSFLVSAISNVEWLNRLASVVICQQTN
jgi:GT2 family glycosyltransferase